MLDGVAHLVRAPPWATRRGIRTPSAAAVVASRATIALL